jgi:molybdopterin-guanine dinucleotide biosynthesis protein A
VSVVTEPVSGLVLAGGKGSRLGGVNKALVRVGDRSNIERVLDVLSSVCQEIVLIANDQALAQIYGARVVFDHQPHAGVLPALAQGLRSTRSELVVVVACDMPFLSGELLAEQLRLSQAVDVVIPLVEARPEPMHAVYRREVCRRAITASLEAGERRMISFLDRVRVRYVEEEELRRIDPDLRSFFNTNTPEDLEQARRLAAAD